MPQYKHRTVVALLIFAAIGLGALMYISWTRRKHRERENFTNVAIPSMHKPANDISAPVVSNVTQSNVTHDTVKTVKTSNTTADSTANSAINISIPQSIADSDDEDTIFLETIADLFNVPDDVMDEYGITKEELDRRVLLYRSDVLEPKQRTVAHTQNYIESKHQNVKNIVRETAKLSFKPTLDKEKLAFERRGIYINTPRRVFGQTE